MGLYSMTGFGSSNFFLSTSSANIPAVLVIKTLNNRFMEITCKLPQQFSFLEADIFRRCKENFLRGSVYVSLHTVMPQALKTNVVTSSSLVGGYIQEIRKLQEKFGIDGSLTLGNILALPGLFEVVEDTSFADNGQYVLKIIDEVIAKVMDARSSEGLSIYNDLLARVKKIGSCFEIIKERTKIFEDHQKSLIFQDIISIFSEPMTDESKNVLHSAIQSLLKVEINEEIVRFEHHLKTFLCTIQDAELQKAKKLDFILQELFREINTIAAKLLDTQASDSIIIIKVELEKAREQIQNIV